MWPGARPAPLDVPPYPHDPEKAKALLKAAGQENLTFTLPIAPALGGYIEAGTPFAQQAKAAGITVKLNNVAPGTYFAYPQFPNRLIQASSGTIYASLAPQYRGLFTTGSPIDETHWGTPARDKLLNQAIGETDVFRDGLTRRVRDWAALVRGAGDDPHVLVEIGHTG